MKKETRAYYMPDGLQVRAVETDGIFEGYAVVWDIVDSHNTRFKKGAFKKTLQERGDKIKILNQHNADEPIGKPLVMREDDTGLFVRGQLTAGVTKADDMRLNIEAEVIDTLSIGFNTIKDNPNGNVRDITEAKLYEFSPVTFASNEQAKITGFRSEDFTEPDNEQPKTEEPQGDADTDTGDPTNTRDGDPTDGNQGADPPKPDLTVEFTEKGEFKMPNLRATDFSDTMDGEELYQRKWLLMDSLHITLADIWWSDMDNDEILMALDTALAEFHNQYLAWAREFVFNFWENRHEIIAKRQDLASVVNYELHKSGETVDTLAAKTTFTADELKTLTKGDLLPFVSRGKLDELPEKIKVAHQEKRRAIVESYCDELRSGGFAEAEKVRFMALLGVSDSIEDKRSGMGGILTNLNRLRDTAKE